MVTLPLMAYPAPILRLQDGSLVSVMRGGVIQLFKRLTWLRLDLVVRRLQRLFAGFGGLARHGGPWGGIHS